MSGPTRVKVTLTVLICLGLFAAANAHLIWTAFRSDPVCVPHLKAPGLDGHFRAAQSSC